ncbi:MAG: hypothetical protein WD605_02640 [Candidatus Paceibacterota bacterium]
MTTKIFTNSLAVIVTATALAIIGITFAYASEVTGTLSSDATGTVSGGSEVTGTLSSDATGGNLNGTVSGGSIAGGSSSGGSVGGSSNLPSGSVLGASTDNLSAPAFPNAGFSPGEIK